MSDSAPIQSIIQLTAFDAEARRDPQPRLKALRETCPVFRDDMMGTWMLSRFADVRGVVNDRSMLRHPSNAEEQSFAYKRLNPDFGTRPTSEMDSILTLDDPDHGRIRTPLAKALYARVAKAKSKVEAIVDEVLSKVEGRAEFDLIGDVAIPIPIVTIARILGVDDQRLDEFRVWSEQAILGLNPVRTPEQTAEMEIGQAALNAYFDELMTARRAVPQDDLVSDMVGLQADGANLSDIEMRINLMALLIGGNLTTTDLIGNGVRLLLLHPEQKAKLMADPSLSPGAVEEILRYEGPVDSTARILPEDRTVAGCPMKAHQQVSVSLRAANRDPAIFTDPETFDITRKGQPHVSFGGGAHICIGAPLARMEAVAFFSTFFQRFPTLRIAETGEPSWRALPFFRGMEHFRVAV